MLGNKNISKKKLDTMVEMVYNDFVELSVCGWNPFGLIPVNIQPTIPFRKVLRDG